MKLFFWCKKCLVPKRDHEKDAYAPVGMGWGAGTVENVIIWAYKTKGMDRIREYRLVLKSIFSFSPTPSLAILFVSLRRPVRLSHK